MDLLKVETVNLDSDKVLESLERILASVTFARSDRLRRFLRYVVLGGIQGDIGQLKESVIGTEVFDRAVGYDPKIEPIVRIEARRLRAKLQEYYSTEGKNDPVIIDLPKGGYVPQFLDRQPSPHQSSSSSSRLVLQKMHKPLTTRWVNSQPRVGLMLLSTLLITIIIAYFLLKTPEKLQDSHILAVTDYFGNELTPAISPDGKQVVFTRDDGTGNYDLFVKIVGENSAVRLTTDPAHDLSPNWSPDGTRIAFLRLSPRSADVMIISALGGSEQRVTSSYTHDGRWRADATQITQLSRPAWTADGKHLAIVDSSKNSDQTQRIYLTSLDGSNKRVLTAPPPGYRDAYPAVSPKGDKLAFTRRKAIWADDIYIMPIQGGRPNRITFEEAGVRGIAWTADGLAILASCTRAGSYQLWRIPINGDSPQLLRDAGHRALDPSVSLDGNRVVFTEFQENNNAWRSPILEDAVGKQPQKLISSSGTNEGAQYSPDGLRIVFVSSRFGNGGLWLCNSDGNNPVRLIHLPGLSVGSPRWSPDGQWVAFDVTDKGQSSIYRIDVKGGAPQRVTAPGIHAFVPTWSRDGQWIYFTSTQGVRTQLWKQRVDSGTAVLVSDSDSWEAFETADGYLYYARMSQPGIVQLNMKTRQEKVVPELALVQTNRHWASTDLGIWFVPEGLPPHHIQFFDFRTRLITTRGTISKPIGDGISSLSVSPNGEWILYTQQDYGGSDIMMLEYSKPEPANKLSKEETLPTQLPRSSQSR